MFELWARRKEGSFEMMAKFDRKEEIYCRLDELDNGEFVEGIVLYEGHCLMYKKYEMSHHMHM